MELLQLQNISKTFENQEKPAVNNVSFEVKKGEFFSIVGESGSGKSTLLNLISALEVADSGDIILKDKKITHFALNLVKGHPEIKPVFQNYNLLPYHKIHENISYALRRYTKEYEQFRTNELLQLCGLEEVKNKIPRELSGGEQQRTALAVALAQNPTLITADEPFSNLDSILKERFRAEFQRIIKEAGVTIIFVTHDFRDALSLSDRIAVMQKGNILQIDTPQEIYQNPVNEYVARLFGEINCIPTEKFSLFFPTNSQNEQVFIRPEKFKITDTENATFQGKIINRVYFGNYYFYTIQNTDFQVIVQDINLIELGKKVGVENRIEL